MSALGEATAERLSESVGGPQIKFLGLAGMAGVGKDYVREWLCERSTLDVIRVAFADGVRQEVIDYLFVDENRRTELFAKPYSYEIRRLLQWWGTDLRREQDPDYWVRYGMGVALELAVRCPVSTIITFTDVRFKNEAEAIRRAGGRVLQVMAPAEVRRSRIGQLAPADHPSEKIDFGVDGWIDNSRLYGDPMFSVEDAAWLGI